MNYNLTQRKARQEDLRRIIELLMEDELGSTREHLATDTDGSYIRAFEQIAADPNQYLMVVEAEGVIIATCHLTIMPSLTFKGSTRMQIEAVRVAQSMRGRKIGEWIRWSHLSRQNFYKNEM